MDPGDNPLQRYLRRLQPDMDQYAQQQLNGSHAFLGNGGAPTMPTAVGNHQQSTHLNGSHPFQGNGGVPTMPTTVGSHQQNTHFFFDSVPAAPPLNPVERVYSNGSPSPVGWPSIEPPRKKRGRPKKYPPADGLGLGISSSANAGCMYSTGDHGTQTVAKRGRGRPPGPAKRQLDALGAAGTNFCTHVIIVDKDQDIASKINDLSQNGPRTIFIISAAGSVSNITLRVPKKSDGSDTVTYQGQYDIMSLSVSAPLSQTTDDRRLDSLKVLFTDSGGVIVGGPVVGTLKAATPVQIIAGSFSIGEKKSNIGLPSPPPPHPLNFNTPEAVYIPSPVASGELPEENNRSTTDISSGPFIDSSQPYQNIQHIFS